MGLCQIWIAHSLKIHLILFYFRCKICRLFNFYIYFVFSLHCTCWKSQMYFFWEKLSWFWWYNNVKFPEVLGLSLLQMGVLWNKNSKPSLKYVNFNTYNYYKRKDKSKEDDLYWENETKIYFLYIYFLYKRNGVLVNHSHRGIDSEKILISEKGRHSMWWWWQKKINKT